jgi:MFS family permease
MSSYAFLSFIDMCGQVLIPLVYSTSISFGGLGFDPYRIGIIMGSLGILNAFVQLVFFGRIIRKFGARNTFIVAQMAQVVIFGLYPLLTFFARHARRADSKVWAVLIIQLILMTGSAVAYGMLALFSYVPLISDGNRCPSNNHC